MEKIYISADTEGLNGVTSFRQVLPEYKTEYIDMQKELHAELNALIKGLKCAGIKEIVINDAHNTMTNISLSELPEDVILISGKPKKVSMMYGLDKTFDGVILFAYHAMAASEGVLAHTFNMFFKSVWLNGEKIGEAKLNGIYAKLIGVPVVLSSGDDVFADEIRTSLPNINIVQTKKAVSNTAAICRKKDELYSEYELAGRNIDNFSKCEYSLSDKYELKVELRDALTSQKIASETNLTAEGNFIVFDSADYVEVYTTLQKISAAITLHKNQNRQV